VSQSSAFPASAMSGAVGRAIAQPVCVCNPCRGRRRPQGGLCRWCRAGRKDLEVGQIYVATCLHPIASPVSSTDPLPTCCRAGTCSLPWQSLCPRASSIPSKPCRPWEPGPPPHQVHAACPRCHTWGVVIVFSLRVHHTPIPSVSPRCTYVRELLYRQGGSGWRWWGSTAYRARR
jgi:hypothetical protein